MVEGNRLKLEVVLNNVRDWFSHHYIQVGLFNMFLMSLVLLRSAGYFEPYLPLTINFIYLFMLFLSIFLLQMRSNGALVVSIAFLLLAGIFKIFSIDVWAERASLYSFEAYALGMILLLAEGVIAQKVIKK